MRRLFLLCSLFPLAGLCADEDAVTYNDHIKPIFRQHCLKCHGDDKQKADLNLQSYAGTLKGGSGGELVVAGRSSQSLLYEIIVDADDDFRMPPNKPPMPEEQIAMIQKWIDTGLRESAGSDSMVAARDLSFQPAATTGGKPENPAMPENLPEIEVPEIVRPLPVLAMDASPWAPLLAVAGQEHVRLLHAETEEELGKLPFPEGVPHVIRFSRDGAVLMVAGGQPVESGKVVLFDVKTGSRLAAIGDEIDAVLAADLSPDQQLVALGGSGKVVKVYSTTDGTLQYKIEKHTDWITAAAFSPDGKILATSDRAGAVHLWDAKSGGILLTLAEHTASVRALDWRSDSKLLASVGEDGLVVWWDVTDGWPAITKKNAHPPHRPKGVYGKLPNGILAAKFGPDGTLFTAGRDQAVRLWDASGKTIWWRHELDGGTPIQSVVVATEKGKTLVVGNSSGQLKFFRVDS